MQGEKGDLQAVVGVFLEEVKCEGEIGGMFASVVV